MVRKPPVAGIDPHLAQWIMFLLSLFFFGIAILGAVGEYLGWWDLIGEVAMTVGTLAGLLLGVASHITTSTETQVDQVQVAVETNGSKLDSIDGKLDKLDGIDAGIDRQTDLLAEIRDNL